MAPSNTIRPFEPLMRSGAYARVLVLSLLSSCSGGWSGSDPEVSPAPPVQAVASPGAPHATVAGASSRTAPPGGAPANAEEPPPLPPLDAARAPALTPELHELRRAAQQHVLGRAATPGSKDLYDGEDSSEDEQPQTSASAPPPASAAPAPTATPGSPAPPPLARFVPIENEAALEHFHEALARLAAGKDEDGKVRILAYGASHTQADAYTGYLRAYLQSRFGDGGQGFVLLGRVNRWYRTLDTRAQHRRLKVRHASYKQDVQNEPLGLFGAAFVGYDSTAYGEVVTSKYSQSTRFEVHYYKQPGGGDFSVQVDGKTVARVETRSGAPGPGYHTFEATPGEHRIRAQLRGNGPVRLFGVTAETSTAGVIVDTLGIGGSRIASQLRWSEDVWADAVRRRNPDLVTFAYGTNETMDNTRTLEMYESELRQVLERLRKIAPGVSCVLIAPFDVPKASRPRLLRIIEAQRRISKEFSCGFWDGYAFMGGAGSMTRWVKAKPALASTDYIHLTNRGYVYAGIAIGDALMRAYDRDPVYWGGASLATPSTASP